MAWYISRARLFACLLTFLVLMVAWLILGHWVGLRTARDGARVTVRLSFLAPMDRQAVLERLSVSSELAFRPVRYEARWESWWTLVLIVDEEDYPRGLRYTLRLQKAPALFRPLSVSAVRRFAVPVPPAMVGLDPQENAPTRGPVVVRFSTPMDPNAARRNLECEFPGDFRPVTEKGPGGETVTDLSRWEFVPRGRMEPESRYRISVGAGLLSVAGQPYKGPAEATFTTAPPFLLMESYPEPGAPSIWLSRRITLRANQKLREAQVRVKGMDGRTSISGETVVFTPERCLRPGRKYRVMARLVSEYGEVLETGFSFATTRLGPKQWLEVRAGEPATVWIMTGDRQLKRLEGRLTRDPAQIPKVTMYEADRGSRRARDGSVSPWVRLNADLMLHALPPGMDKDDHAHLGLPRAYACLIIPANDMDWIARHLEPGFMIIVHE